MRVAWNRKSLLNNTFGRLTVLELDTDKTTTRNIYWLCLCSCGIIKSISGKHLVSEHTKSCGCLSKETSKVIGQSNKGNVKLSDTDRIESSWNKWYRVFLSQARCRGIKVSLTQEQFRSISSRSCIYCDKSPELKKSIASAKYTVDDFSASGIDRIDTLKGYDIENCVPCCYDCNRAKGYITPKMVKQLYHMLIDLGSIEKE